MDNTEIGSFLFILKELVYPPFLEGRIDSGFWCVGSHCRSAYNFDESRAAVSSSIDILFVMDTLFFGMSCWFTIEFGIPQACHQNMDETFVYVLSVHKHCFASVAL